MNCQSCEIELTSNDIGLSKKLFGRNTKYIFCVECLAEYFKKSKDEMFDMIKGFKAQGCELFG
jgi:hypothetical protein